MASHTSADVYLCCVKQDEELCKFLCTKLTDEGFTVCQNYLAKGLERGQALLEAKAVLVVLSSDATSSKSLSDEVCLAYISDKPIFPVTAEDYKSLESALNFSMKLIIAKLNWSFFPVDDGRSFKDDNVIVLISSVKKALSHNCKEYHSQRTSTEVPTSLVHELTTTDSKEASIVPPTFNAWRERVRLSKKEKNINLADFWESNFPDKAEVPWQDFRAIFIETYKERILAQIPEDKMSWVLNLIYGEILQLKKTFTKKDYINFCGGSNELQGDPNRFYHRLMDYARGKIAMAGVFNMDSTLRLTAINNLGQFKTVAVLSSLQSLLSDKDANTRAVAAIALGKTETRNHRVIKKLIKTLKDDDRMVREAACLSLGHLKSTEAIPHVVNVWRNDIISNVRSAALTALRLMDSPEAKEAIRVTQVLDEEVEQLKRSMVMRH